MIGKLKGVLDTLASDHILIDVGGVVYQVFASTQTIAALGNVGNRVTILIETHVREDHIHLYGFAQEAEKEWFKLLQTVSGVGNKLALAILSHLSPDALTLAAASEDKQAFARVSGVGPKLAARLSNELKDKVVANIGLTMPKAATTEQSASSNTGALQDAFLALTALGYSRSEAYQALEAAQKQTPAATSEQLIKATLTQLARASA
jgi:holliday junction DNA helicase RuvA